MLRARKMKVIPASSSHFQARGRHFSDQLALGKEVGEARLTSSKQVSLERQGSSWDSIIFPEEFGPWIHTVPQAHTMWGKLQSVRTPYRTLMTSRPWYFLFIVVLSLSYHLHSTTLSPPCPWLHPGGYFQLWHPSLPQLPPGVTGCKNLRVGITALQSDF